MTVVYRTGDLFTQDLPALAHGVNLRGVMGAGVAKTFRDRCPGLYDAYRERCRSGQFTLGGVYVYRPPVGPIVYNLATQDRPGPHADLSAIRAAVTVMAQLAETDGIPAIGLPRIGAGIGGLHWPDVADVIHDVAGRSPVQLVVVSLPARSEGAPTA